MLVPSISTARLSLRAYELSDVADLARLIGAREVAENLVRVPYPYTEQDARNFILSLKESSEASFAITLLDDQHLIGGIGLRIDPHHPRAELGYWLGTLYWGRGYARKPHEAWSNTASPGWVCIVFTLWHSGKTRLQPRCCRSSA